FDLVPRPAAEEWELVADCRVLMARAGTLRRSRRGAGVELPVHDDEAPSRTEDPDPLGDCRLRARERPEQMTADGEVKAAGRERELLGVGFLEPDRDAKLRRLAPRLGDPRGREVDAGDVMAAGRELEGEEAGAAAGIERLERTSAHEDEVEDAVPGGALGGRADAVAEVLVEVRRPPLPVGGDLSLDDVSHYAFSLSARLAKKLRGLRWETVQ